MWSQNKHYWDILHSFILLNFQTLVWKILHFQHILIQVNHILGTNNHMLASG